jgi:hypothetical protein
VLRHLCTKKYLTSEVSTTDIWDITACSPVSNDDLLGKSCCLYFWYGRDIWYINKLIKKRHWAEMKRNIGYLVTEKQRETEVHN